MRQRRMKAQILVPIYSDGNQEVVELEKETRIGELVLSLHVAFSYEEYKTMKLQGFIKKQPVMILLDTGSTHNFINYPITKNLVFKVQPIAQMHVSIANGEKVIAQSKCIGLGLQWQVQGEQFQDEFILIPLTGCDVVLGI
ncbi:Retrotransposon-related protein [Quillaja saponaria]|uniref:Retrotransposon-related protein n=1 Tax=Quillaja saponaria TaxID=32244 RepID=A0AAD7KNF3_QUISA|nr:Retrotransposon-related protein [Quillaja saponaria]